jgi:malate dehydrogenase (quinone)
MTRSMVRRLFDTITEGRLQWAAMDPVYDKILFGDDCYDYRAGARAFKEELLQSFPDRVNTLREFAPTSQGKDWEIDIAGQRVQVIRRDSKKLGVLEFGTTVLAAADGSIAGLLGASPGASTAVPAMMEVMERCFPGEYPGWEPKLKEMVPSLGANLSDEPRLFAEVWDHGTRVLGLQRRADAGHV